MINIVIPMAGKGSRFANEGYTIPKPFIDVNGKPMIVRVMENLNVKDSRFILLARKEHLEDQKEVVKKISKKFGAIFIPIDKMTEGTVCSVLFARELINSEDPLIIANSDQIVDIEMQNFMDDCVQRKLDGSIITFVEESRNNKWSYAKVNENGIISEVKEKVAISEIATVGIYLYMKGKDFVNSAIDMIINNDRINNEFYTCPTYNYGIANGLKIGSFIIERNKMHGMGIPDDLKSYIEYLVKNK